MGKIIALSCLIIIIGVSCSTAQIIAQEQQDNSNQQVQQITMTGVQGNLVELAEILGNAKAFLIELEASGRNTLMLNFAIRQTAQAIQQAKDLLARYDYPNKEQIQVVVNDLEQRLFSVVMSL